MGTAKITDEFISSQELKREVSARIDGVRKQIITKEDLGNSISGQELVAAVCERIENFTDK